MTNINKVLVTIASVVLVAMAAMITYDVFLRFVFNSPLPASVEISQLMEPYVVFLPFAYTLAMKRHVRVTLLTIRLPLKARKVCELITYTLDMIFFALLCYYSWLEFASSYLANEFMLAAIILPWWVGKFSMPLGMLFIVIQCLIHLKSTVKATEV